MMGGGGTVIGGLMRVKMANVDSPLEQRNLLAFCLYLTHTNRYRLQRLFD